MARPLAKSPFALLALGLWISMVACIAALGQDEDPKALNQQVVQLIEQGEYQSAPSGSAANQTEGFWGRTWPDGITGQYMLQRGQS